MTVYALHAVGTDLVKFGFTAEPNPIRRMMDFRTGSPHLLVILTYVPGAPRILERELLSRYRHKRKHGGGREWFVLNKAVDKRAKKSEERYDARMKPKLRAWANQQIGEKTRELIEDWKAGKFVSHQRALARLVEIIEEADRE